MALGYVCGATFFGDDLVGRLPKWAINGFCVCLLVRLSTGQAVGVKAWVSYVWSGN